MQTFIKTCNEMAVATLCLIVLGILGMAKPAVVGTAGITPVNPPAVVNVTLVGAAPDQDVQTTVYWCESCPPCLRYLGGTDKHRNGLKDYMPKDGWVLRNATDKDAAAAHVVFDDRPESFAKYKIDRLPCTVIRKNGKELRRIEGVISADDLAANHNEVGGKP